MQIKVLYILLSHFIFQQETSAHGMSIIAINNKNKLTLALNRSVCPSYLVSVYSPLLIESLLSFSLFSSNVTPDTGDACDAPGWPCCPGVEMSRVCPRHSAPETFPTKERIFVKTKSKPSNSNSLTFGLSFKRSLRLSCNQSLIFRN